MELEDVVVVELEIVDTVVVTELPAAVTVVDIAVVGVGIQTPEVVRINPTSHCTQNVQSDELTTVQLDARKHCGGRVR